MAPRALLDLDDSTGYSPSFVNYASILSHFQVRSNSRISNSKVAALASNDAFGYLTAARGRSQNHWQLSSQEIGDIDASVKHFRCKLPWSPTPENS